MASASGEPDSRVLLLLRHGKAELPQGQDIDRNLTDKGIRQAQIIGDYLAAQSAGIDRVLVSPAQRTRTTWESVLSVIPGFTGEVTVCEDIYDGGPADVAELLRQVDDDDRVVLVVGHEPTMSTLAHVLADEDSDSGALAQARIGVSTGTLCILSGPLAHWADLTDGSMSLQGMIRP
ncbi:SixA phosphatase family protein [Devriesea agamarum]|uniref:SixA phosphatase family protein n=1 Tax=Devriesea agamarum TaxID=472569 RepID=UPI00071D2AEB|nr:histidine phosphatase family protein [Devriesea agamarum]